VPRRGRTRVSPAVRESETARWRGRQQGVRQKERTGRRRWEAGGGPGRAPVLVSEPRGPFGMPASTPSFTLARERGGHRGRVMPTCMVVIGGARRVSVRGRVQGMA
jgi:hypothetical protein